MTGLAQNLRMDVNGRGPRVGGWGGIRTHEELAPPPVFKTGAFNRSATHPAPPHSSILPYGVDPTLLADPRALPDPVAPEYRPPSGKGGCENAENSRRTPGRNRSRAV